MSRAELLADLERALAPDQAPSKLAVIAFPGLREYLETASQEVGSAWEATTLLERLTTRVRQVTPADVRVYNSRRGEFTFVCPADSATNWTAITAALDEEMWSTGVRTAFVVLAIPAEADTAVGALRLADTRIRAPYGTLRPGGRPRLG
jgi:hypothetical protein